MKTNLPALWHIKISASSGQRWITLVITRDYRVTMFAFRARGTAVKIRELQFGYKKRPETCLYLQDCDNCGRQSTRPDDCLVDTDIGPGRFLVILKKACDFAECFYRGGLIMASPSTTTVPSWLTQVVFMSTLFFSVMISITSTVAVMVSPMLTGARNLRL